MMEEDYVDPAGARPGAETGKGQRRKEEKGQESPGPRDHPQAGGSGEFPASLRDVSVPAESAACFSSSSVFLLPFLPLHTTFAPISPVS